MNGGGAGVLFERDSGCRIDLLNGLSLPTHSSESVCYRRFPSCAFASGLCCGSVCAQPLRGCAVLPEVFVVQCFEEGRGSSRVRAQLTLFGTMECEETWKEKISNL